jgi:hypothetical protein
MGAHNTLPFIAHLRLFIVIGNRPVVFCVEHLQLICWFFQLGYEYICRFYNLLDVLVSRTASSKKGFNHSFHNVFSELYVFDLLHRSIVIVKMCTYQEIGVEPHG